MKRLTVGLIFLIMVMGCGSQGKDASKGRPITDPKIGEWVWYEGFGEQNSSTYPGFKAQAKQIQDFAKYDTEEWHSYNCSLGVVKEERMTYRRYATQEEINAVLPLK